MTDEEGGKGRPDPSLKGHAALEIRANAALVTDSQAQGVQSLDYADIQIRVEDAAHQRELERHRVDRELERDRLEQQEKLTERKHQRFRENASYCIITGLVVAGLVASFYVAVNTTDVTTKAWAQGIVTTLAGGAAGAFFGYMTGKSDR